MDIIAGIIEIIAIYIVGNKNRWGWAIGFACCLLWMAYVFQTKASYGILIPTIPCMFINVRNFFKWGKEESDKRRKRQIDDLFKPEPTPKVIGKCIMFSGKAPHSGLMRTYWRESSVMVSIDELKEAGYVKLAEPNQTN